MKFYIFHHLNQINEVKLIDLDQETVEIPIFSIFKIFKRSKLTRFDINSTFYVIFNPLEHHIRSSNLSFCLPSNLYFLFSYFSNIILIIIFPLNTKKRIEGYSIKKIIIILSFSSYSQTDDGSKFTHMSWRYIFLSQDSYFICMCVWQTREVTRRVENCWLLRHNL